MIYESALISFLAAFFYWLGCKRTQVKFDLFSLMTPAQYKCFVEIKLYVAKGIIVLLLALVIWFQHNA
jgi:hypothetical protein